MATPQPAPAGAFFSLFGLPPTVFRSESLEQLGRLMARARVPGSTGITSGYVYLGQFIAHDVTRLEKPRNEVTPAEDLVQLRTPALDLDSVYGNGFDDPEISVNKSTGEMNLGPVDGGKRSLDDLPRKPNSTVPHIADDRNDENLLVAQLHVQFLKLHNFFVAKIGNDNPGISALELFEAARGQLILHYQQVVLYDFLDNLIDPRVWQYVVGNNRGSLWNPIRSEAARMPVEFSAAALRFGHSMVRPDYTINAKRSAELAELFEMTGRGGFKGKPSLPATHVVDWRFFFRRDPRRVQEFMNMALAIDPVVPIELHAGEVLAVNNLKTGNVSRLPDGQTLVRHIQKEYPDLARELGLQLLTADELNPEVSVLDGQLLRVTRLLDELGADHGFAIKTPLWYYLLAEARATRAGQHLGVLGSLIAAEALRALVWLSRPSVLAENFESRYIEPTKDIHGRRYLTMNDLLAAIAED